jgi:hypothetical protein
MDFTSGQRATVDGAPGAHFALDPTLDGPVLAEW